MTARPKMLIVEDAKDLLEVWMSLLKINDAYTVKAVSQAKTAVEVVRSGYHPDVLITDYFLGDATGLDLADEIKQITRDLGVIVATGSHDNQALKDRAEAGEIKLLIKPVRFKDLTENINALLQQGRV